MPDSSPHPPSPSPPPTFRLSLITDNKFSGSLPSGFTRLTSMSYL